MAAPSPSLDQLRSLRDITRGVGNLVDDLKPFLHDDKKSFRRLPTDRSTPGDIRITGTASCLMALSLARKLEAFYGKDYASICKRVFNRIAKRSWQSSQLPECNAFTVTVLLRAIHFLGKYAEPNMQKAILAQQKATPVIDEALRAPNSKACDGQSYESIVTIFADGVPTSLAVGRYPASPVIAYWFVDALSGLGVTLDESWWQDLSVWTATELRRQAALVAAEAHDRIDPVAMAMAACLAQRVRRHGHGKYEEHLPSIMEVRHAIRILFSNFQLPSGIWNKYFPLFHYPDAGSNYCFAFEMLEAVLNEFADDLVIEEQAVFNGFELATSWCRDNRIKYFHDEEYNGWNSGGDVEALSKGMPEAWATAVVHMYLVTLDRVLTGLIERRILERYRVVTTSRTWNEQLDSDVTLPGNRKVSIKDLLTEHLTEGLNQYQGLARARLRFAPLPRDQRRSVLLFGPPGTSKTTLVRAFAQYVLDWPCIEITPSNFLDKGLPEIYQRATEVFDDLGDLSGVVVLFDEMDALSRRRDGALGASIDVTSQFLTTSMLPKLAKLHDDGRVVFFMLTNHRRDFDPAITRPGRFDLLICQGPPEAAKKIGALSALLEGKYAAAQLELARTVLGDWMTNDDEIAKSLDRFTVDEFKALLESIQRAQNMPLGEALTHIGQAKFASEAAEWATSAIVLNSTAQSNSPQTLLDEWRDDMKNSRIQ